MSTTNEPTAETTDERIHRLVAGILNIAADLENDGPHRLPLSPRKLAAALRSLASPGLDPAMNDGWTLRALTLAMREMERELAAQGFEMGSIGDGPYPPWEVAMAAIGDLRMDLGAEKDQTQQLASAVERLEDELAGARKVCDGIQSIVARLDAAESAVPGLAPKWSDRRVIGAELRALIQSAEESS